MASNAVSVLAPNGRRQTVKCTPNTTIMQIIEEVCKKQGYEPEDYDVKHHNKTLDTTMTFRFSGLPNNAQLELAPAAKARLDSDVTLAMNLENGTRVMGTFLPDATLWEILNNLCPDQVAAEQHPVVVYTRREIYGDELRSTTLRSLGLRSGRAMVRLVHKSPEELKTQANVSAPLPSKPAEEKPYHRTLKTEPVASAAEELPGPSAREHGSDQPGTRPVQKNTNLDLLKMAREKRKLPESPAKSADAEKALPKSKPKINRPREEDNMEVDGSGQASSQFKEGDDPASPEENFIFLGKRNAMLFSLESAQTIRIDDLPDDFFELTVADVKKVFKDITKKRHDIENGVLMTSAMRNLEESKKQLRKLNKYQKTVIRVQFPDRTVLQGIFSSAETVADVVGFVREYLEDRSIDFYLYTTPPKCILSEEEGLVEKGCVPGALLHLGSSSIENVRLKADVRDKFTTNSMASLAASKQRQEFTRKNAEIDDMEQDQFPDTVVDINAPGPSSQPEVYERKVVKSTENVPKWFRPSK